MSEGGTQRTCRTCKWADPWHDEMYRECRKSPPVVVSHGHCSAARFPHVSVNTWCGEWSSGDEDALRSIAASLREIELNTRRYHGGGPG
jgi:hypothetical protein